MYDYLIVGSGFFGSICAYELNKKGYKCLVLEKRNHIGGNCFTEKRHDINVHIYGPHIFHTSNEKVWNWINQFTTFNNFTLRPVANYNGEIYSLPFNMHTFSKMWNISLPKEAKEIIKEQGQEIINPSNLEEQAIKLVGKDVYEKLIKGYTKKQWKKDPKDLPKEIIQRLPVRFNYDNNYFNDKFQGIPIGGYTQIFEKLLQGIEVRLNVNYLDDREYWNGQTKKIIYTGPIDEYFNFMYGELEYKTTNFVHELINTDNYQGTAMMNYTDEETEYIRCVEHKHFENSLSEQTWITKEYPTDYKSKETEPLYPVNDEINNEIYKKYRLLSDDEPNVYFGGRLAEYKYYDMHKVIESALNKVEEILTGVKKTRNFLIHNPCNENTRYYREYNLFWDELTDELKKKYNIIENRYYEGAHYSRMQIQLQKRTQEFLDLLECEYVIEDLDNGDFWILSIAEQMSGCILTESNNPHLKKVLYSQYIPEQIVHHTKENANKYLPWIFFQQDVVDLEKYYENRKEKKELIPRLFFRGNTQYRPIVDYIDKEILSDTKKIENKDYFDLLTDYEICLSIGGVANGDLCYRDVECMALGIPLLRFDFVATLNPPLIPNYHYISIPLQLDLPKERGVHKDRLGDEKHAKLIEQRFHEVIQNKNFLNYISKNAREYYEKYLSKESRVQHTLNLLNL